MFCCQTLWETSDHAESWATVKDVSACEGYED